MKSKCAHNFFFYMKLELFQNWLTLKKGNHGLLTRQYTWHVNNYFRPSFCTVLKGAGNTGLCAVFVLLQECLGYWYALNKLPVVKVCAAAGGLC